jgi:P-type E1-E2 ATPase
MLTGDNKETAQKIASALNIPEFRAELKPEDKAEIVRFSQLHTSLFKGFFFYP